MANQIQMRRDTSANWASFNPVPLQGEICVDTTLENMFKIGNGVDHFADLPWASMDLNDPALATKITTVGAGAFAPLSLSADVTAIDSRLSAVEESGVVKTSVTPYVMTSNANTFATLGAAAPYAGQYVVGANVLEVGDTLSFTGIMDMLNNSGGSVVYDLQFLVGSFRLTGTPATAGFSIAAGALRRPLHVWVDVTVKDATHFHVAAGFQLASTKAAADEAALFNGTTTAFDSINNVTNAAINIANSMTFALQGKIRTNSASTELVLIRPTWSISKGAL